MSVKILNTRSRAENFTSAKKLRDSLQGHDELRCVARRDSVRPQHFVPLERPTYSRRMPTNSSARRLRSFFFWRPAALIGRFQRRNLQGGEESREAPLKKTKQFKISSITHDIFLPQELRSLLRLLSQNIWHLTEKSRKFIDLSSLLWLLLANLIKI